MDEASVTIGAPPQQVWALVSDITKMGRFSPSNTGGKWLGGVKEPAVGAKFLGFNKRGIMRWATRCQVIECEQPNRFAFKVLDNNSEWGFRLEPNGTDGTMLTQWRNCSTPPPAVAGLAGKLLFRGKIHEEMNDGIRATLEAIKAAAEKA